MILADSIGIDAVLLFWPDTDGDTVTTPAPGVECCLLSDEGAAKEGS
jgi:hypothetical protein